MLPTWASNQSLSMHSHCLVFSAGDHRQGLTPTRQVSCLRAPASACVLTTPGSLAKTQSVPLCSWTQNVPFKGNPSRDTEKAPCNSISWQNWVFKLAKPTHALNLGKRTFWTKIYLLKKKSSLSFLGEWCAKQCLALESMGMLLTFLGPKANTSLVNFASHVLMKEEHHLGCNSEKGFCWNVFNM